MKKINGMIFALAAIALLAGLAGLAGAEVSAVSEDAPLDTRSLSAVTADKDQALDSRSFTQDWSAPQNLNTKKVVGTTILIR